MPSPNTLLRVFRSAPPTAVAPWNGVDSVGKHDVRGGQRPLRDVVVVDLAHDVVLHFVVGAIREGPFPSAEVPQALLAVADDRPLAESVLREREQVVRRPDGYAALFHFPHALYAACASAHGHELALAHVVLSPVVAAPLAFSSAPLAFVVP